MTLHSSVKHENLLPLADLWTMLVAGRVLLVDSQYSEHRCFATLQSRPAFQRSAQPSAQHLLILERVLLGESQKAIAIDLDLAVSTVTFACNTALAAIGEPRSASRAFVLWGMAAHAAHGMGLRHQGRLAAAEDPTGQCWTISVERPDSALPACLSAAEQFVVRSAVEGCAYTEIAARRQVSPRTIANQFASVFRKLGVSGRTELLRYLIRGDCLA